MAKKPKEKPEIVESLPTVAAQDPVQEQPKEQAKDFAGRLKLRYLTKEEGETFMDLLKKCGAGCQVTPLKGASGVFCQKLKFSGFTVVQDVK